ncbi:Protein Asterix, partial [Nibea albiflora]
RYKPPSTETNPTLEDPTPDYMNLLGMIFSMCGLMLKLKWCAWIAVYCSFISFANSRSSEDTKQMMSSFMAITQFHNNLFDLLVVQEEKSVDANLVLPIGVNSDRQIDIATP